MKAYESGTAVNVFPDLRGTVSSVNVTPGAATLTLTTFASSVTTTAHINVTPGAASLALTTFAPTVATTGGTIAKRYGYLQEAV